MSDQSNSAAERSAHVTRGEKPAPAEWPVVRMPNGTWKLKSVVALEARIAKLETHLEERKMNSGLVWCICSEADDRIKELKARIAELEAALRDVLPYVDTCNSSHREAQEKGYAALEGGEMSDDPYKSFDHHIKAQEAEITRLRAAINDALTAPWPDPELNSTWRQEPIGPNETPEEAIKRLVSVRAEWAVYKNNCENPVIAELRAALEGGKDE